jgi:hypothetical protein
MKTVNIDESDEERIDETEELVKRDDDSVIITNLDGKSPFRIKNKNAKINSDFVKRLEVDHIVSMIEGINVWPDFGFPYTYPYGTDDKEKKRPWELIWDFIQAGYKFERIENYIQAMHL